MSRCRLQSVKNGRLTGQVFVLGLFLDRLSSRRCLSGVRGSAGPVGFPTLISSQQGPTTITQPSHFTLTLEY